MYTGLPTLQKLRSNKTALQIILLFLTELNEIEIQLITKRRALLANVTALWFRITDADKKISDLWRMLLTNLNQELTMRWNEAVSLRKDYEDAIGKTVSHLEVHTPPSERQLLFATHETLDTEAAAKLAYKKANKPYEIFSIVSDKSKKQSSTPEIGKADLAFRQKHARLNTLRRQFVGVATDAYTNLIEEQHGIVNLVKTTLHSYITTRAKHACHIVRTSPQMVDTLAAFSPFDLAARQHHGLQYDLQSPQYTPLSFVDPKSNAIRSRALVGVELRDEENPDNSLLAVLLETSFTYPGFSKGKSTTKRVCPKQVHKELVNLESHWLSEPLENKTMLSRRSFETRHSLMILYLSSLPSPLLPLSNQQFTQFALKQTKLYTLLETLPPVNLKLLGELCHYLSRLHPHDDSVVRQFGNLVLRADSDLMSDGSRVKSITGLMTTLMRYFRKVKERTVLDIARSPTPDWCAF